MQEMNAKDFAYNHFIGTNNNRYDVFVRCLAIDNYFGKNDYGFNMYNKMQKLRVGTDKGYDVACDFAVGGYGCYANADVCNTTGTQRFSGLFLTQGSAGTLGSADYLRTKFPSLKVAKRSSFIRSVIILNSSSLGILKTDCMAS